MYLEIWYDIVRQTHTQRGDARRKTKRVMWIKKKTVFFVVVARTGRSFPRYTHPYWEHNYCVLLFLTLPVEPKTEQSALQNDVSFFQSTELGFFS